MGESRCQYCYVVVELYKGMWLRPMTQAPGEFTSGDVAYCKVSPIDRHVPAGEVSVSDEEFERLVDACQVSVEPTILDEYMPAGSICAGCSLDTEPVKVKPPLCRYCEDLLEAKGHPIPIDHAKHVLDPELVLGHFHSVDDLAKVDGASAARAVQEASDRIERSIQVRLRPRGKCKAGVLLFGLAMVFAGLGTGFSQLSAFGMALIICTVVFG